MSDQIQAALIDAIRDSTGALIADTPEHLADVVLAVIEPILWRARHTVNGRCRYCAARTLTPGGSHRMSCRFYRGPLEHRWIKTSWNGTFGGVDHYCMCGGWFRRGGTAGHGDGTEQAVPTCPNVDQTERVGSHE